jgi:ubiquinone/menaquinone biosynthesis C-methylase UbiE
LPFKDGSFDLVYASHVLEHVPNPIFALREFKRVGKASFLRVPNAVNMAYRIDHNGGTANHFYSWNKATFSNLLSTVFEFVDVGQTIRLLPNHRFRKKLLVYAVTAFSCRNELTAYCK